MITQQGWLTYEDAQKAAEQFNSYSLPEKEAIVVFRDNWYRLLIVPRLKNA